MVWCDVAASGIKLVAIHLVKVLACFPPAVIFIAQLDYIITKLAQSWVGNKTLSFFENGFQI